MTLKPALESVENIADLCGLEDDAAIMVPCFMSGPWELNLSLCSPGDSGTVFPWYEIIIYNEALTQK